jgi:hypothetical protein
MERIQRIIKNASSIVPVKLTQSYNQLGTSEELDKYVDEEVSLAINQIVDKELIRVRPSSLVGTTITPKFEAVPDGDNYIYAGFSINKIQMSSDSLINSMFIFEFFDSPYSESQKKISHNFVKSDNTGTFIATYSTDGSVLTKRASLLFSNESTSKEMNIIYIPSYLLNGNEVFSVYMQVSFFNALTGKRLYFRNTVGDNEARNFIEITINPLDKTYNFGVNGNIIIEKYEKGVDLIDENNASNPRTHIKTKRGTISELLTGKFRLEAPNSINQKIKNVTVANNDWYDKGFYEIRWDYSGATEQVKITLIYQDNGYEKVIVNSAPCTGSYLYKSNNDPFEDGSNGFKDDNNFIDLDGDGYNDVNGVGSMARSVLVKVELIGNVYDYQFSDDVVIHKYSSPPIAWGTPAIPNEWYKNNEYLIQYNIPPQNFQGVDMRDKMSVSIGLEYRDRFGNVCKPITNTLTCLSEWEPSAVSGYTRVWANELTLFNADYSKGYAEVTVKLIDLMYSANTLSTVIKYYNQRNGTSVDYRKTYYDGVESTTPPSQPKIEFSGLTKPVSGSTVYAGRQFRIDWSPKVGGRNMRIGYVFYDESKQYYNFWQNSSYYTSPDDYSAILSPFKTVPADKVAIYSSTFGIDNWNGSINDGFIIVQDNEYQYGNFLSTPVKLSRLSAPQEPQQGLNLVPNSISIQHKPYEGYTGVTAHTQFLENQPYEIKWSDANLDTYVNIDLIYTNPSGDIEKVNMNKYGKINDGVETVELSFTQVRMNEETTINSVVRVSDEYYSSTFIDSGTMTITMPANYYYDYGYRQGYILKTLGNPSDYNDTPPPLASSTQSVSYKEGYQKGYNDGTPYNYTGYGG